MKLSTLFTPFFLLFLAIFSTVTWSAVDSQQLSLINPAASGSLGLFSGKGPLLLAAAGFLPFVLMKPDLGRQIGPILSILLATAGLSLFWSVAPYATIFALTQLALVIGYPFIAVQLLGVTKTLRIVWVFSSLLILASVALAAVGDAHALMGGIHEGRWRGLFSHKNIFGPFIATNLLVTLYARPQLRLPPWLLYLVIIMDVIGLVGAQSAAALMAATCGIVAGIYFLPIKSKQLRWLWRVMSVCAIFGAAAALTFKVDWILQFLGRDLTLSNRTLMWKHALDISFARPLGTGYGTGGGPEVSFGLQNLFSLQRRVSVQSGYLNLALELGWVSVAAFAAWTSSLLASNLTSDRRNLGATLLVALVVQHLIISITEVFGGLSPSWSLAIIMISLAASRMYAVQDTGRRGEPAALHGAALRRS